MTQSNSSIVSRKKTRN